MTMGTVPSKVYDEIYFADDPSWSRFLAAQGKNWTMVDSYVLSLCDIRPGMAILEVGCGSGGFIFTCARERRIFAVGIDYAAEAIRIASQVVRGFVDEDFVGQLHFVRADAARLPLRDCSFDVIYSCFLVEHLFPEELYSMLRDSWRLLKPGGRVIIETAPNLWRLKYGFPLTRLAYRIPVLARLYKQMMDMTEVPWQAKTDEDARYHVNEQSVVSLKKVMRQAGFRARTWVGPERGERFTLASFQWRWGRKGRLIWWIYSLFYRDYPFKLIFGDTIFGVGEKAV